MLVGIRRWIHPASGHRCVLGLVYLSAGLSRSHCLCKIVVCASTAYYSFIKQINRKEINE